MMKMTLAITFLVAMAILACGPSATTSDSDPGVSAQPTEKSGPTLLLDEKSAISILQHYLQECLQSWEERWDGPFRTSEYNENNPLSEQEMKLLMNQLMDLASETTGDIAWSASHHGVTEVPFSYTPVRTAIEAETWVVIGPGLESAESQLATAGRWKVYAGHKRADYLDAPARLALQEYNRFLTC